VKDLPSHQEASDRVSVVTVTYNSSDSIETLIFSLMMNLGDIIDEIVIIDNKSSDDTVPKLKGLGTNYPQIRLIKNEINTGYRKAANRGIELANNEIILLTNPDIRIDRSLINCYNEMIRNPDAAICYPRVRTGWLGKFDYHLTRVAIPFVFCYPETYASRSSSLKTRPTDTPGGPIQFIRRAPFLAAGGYDERVFMYGEEEEIFLKLAAQKLTILYVPMATVQHKGSGYFKYYNDSESQRALWWVFYFLCAVEWTMFTKKLTPLQDAFEQFRSRRTLPRQGVFRSPWHIRLLVWTHVFKILRWVSAIT
jgi:GT2 family glycosyltransferase